MIITYEVVGEEKKAKDFKVGEAILCLSDEIFIFMSPEDPYLDRMAEDWDHYIPVYDLRNNELNGLPPDLSGKPVKLCLEPEE